MNGEPAKDGQVQRPGAAFWIVAAIFLAAVIWGVDWLLGLFLG